MSDRPILFNGPMVRAILEGRKTQTRRVLKDWPLAGRGWDGTSEILPIKDSSDSASTYSLPKIVPGDRLWVREAWRTWRTLDEYPPRNIRDEIVSYDVDGVASNGLVMANYGRKRPSIHMPRWASRLTLTVTDVRVQRVQEISGEDCSHEGIEVSTGDLCRDGYMLAGRTAFRSLWDSINADRGFGWDANPWVAAYTFTVDKRNIDA